MINMRKAQYQINVRAVILKQNLTISKYFFTKKKTGYTEGKKCFIGRKQKTSIHKNIRAEKDKLVNHSVIVNVNAAKLKPQI